MNPDLKKAYEKSMMLAQQHTELSVDMLKAMSVLVMKNTGGEYHTINGDFDASKGDFRLLGVTAGTGGSSYMNFRKVPTKMEEFCQQINERRRQLIENGNIIDQYLLSFDAHLLLVTIHPWVDGNGRMSRLVMNHLQYEFGLVPSKVVKEDKAEYMQSLINARESDSPEPFRTFMLEEHIKNLSKEMERYKASQTSDPIKAFLNR